MFIYHSSLLHEESGFSVFYITLETCIIYVTLGLSKVEEKYHILLI